MPLISQLDTPDSLTQGSIGRLPEPFEPGPGPSLKETFGAAFRLENSVVSAIEREEGFHRPLDAPALEGYDPLDDIEGYEEYAGVFLSAGTPEEVSARKRQIDRELEDRALLERSGVAGIGAALAGGLLDPTILIPAGGTAVRGLSVGRSVLQGGLATARAGFVGATAAEALLHGSQETRTLGESAFNVAGATLLSGVLGGSVAALRPTYERIRLGRAFDQVRDDPIGPADDPTVAIRPNEFEKIVLERGPVFEQNGEIRVQGKELGRLFGTTRGYGLAKIIWRHGERSGKAAAERVTRDDVLAFPRIAREFEPITLAGAREADTWSRVYRVRLNGRMVEYGISRHSATDGADRVVNIFVQTRGDVNPANPGALSRRLDGRAEQQGADVTKTGAAPDSSARPIEPLGDTTAEPFGQPARGREAPPADDTLSPSQRFVENTAELGRRVEEELTPDPDLPDLREPGSLVIPEADLRADATGPRQGELPFEATAPRPPRGLPDADMTLRAAEAADPAAGRADTETAAGPGEAGASVGAATALPTRAEETLLSALGVEKATAFTEPLLRTVTSPFLATRRIAQELVRSPLAYEKNALGIASPISVEVRRDAWDWNLARTFEVSDELFLKYRKGEAAKSGRLRTLAVQARDLAGAPAGKLTRRQFNEEIGRAMRLGDAHDIPEVAEAAREFRKTLFDPLKDRAIETGQLPENVSVETATSYLMRVYNTEKIVAQRPDLGRVVTGWLKDRQARRRALQEEIAALAENQKALDLLMGRTAGKTDTQERLIARSGAELQEVRRLLQRDIERAADLRQRGETADAKTKSRNQVKAGELSTSITRLRNRLNTLHDRKSGASAQRDTLLRYLEDLQSRHGVTIDDIDELLELWPGRSTPQVKQVLRARLDLDENELADLGEQIIDRILGTPDGRLPYDVSADVTPAPSTSRPNPERGPLRRRAFAIPDELIEPWLESDIELVSRLYTRTMAADTEIAARFNSVDMVEQIDAIRREHTVQAARAKSDKERVRLNKRKDDDIRDIAAMRDRLRGTFGAPANPHGLGVRAARAVGQVNLLSKLGGVTVSSLPDIGRPMMVEGLARVLRHGLRPMITNARKFKLAREEARFLGAVTERVLDTRMHAIADIGDSFGRHSRAERALQGLSDSFGSVSLIAPWNQFMKEISGTVTMSRILQTSRAWAAGKVSRGDRTRLAAAGIDRDAAVRIAAEFDRHGLDDRGVLIAGTGNWADREAADLLRGAMIREIDGTIVTPGVGQRPLWMSSTAGRLIGQFKSFSFASHQSVLLAGLQRRDAATFNGLLLSVVAGMGVYAIKSWQYGNVPSEDPRVWLAEGVDRSGVTGFFFEANNIAEKVSRGTIGVNALVGGPTMSRYASRNLAGAVLGPSFGTGMDLANIIGAAAAGDFKQSDTRKIRRLLPYQNLFYLRGLIDKAERGINENLGVPE